MDRAGQGIDKWPIQVGSLLLMAILLLVFESFSFYALAGALFSLYILNSLILGLGEGVPVNLVIVFLACLQWVVGPILSYYTGVNHPFYGMHVPENEYFAFIIPGVVLYHMGLMLPLFGVKAIPKSVVGELGEDASSKIKSAYYLIGIGFAASFIRPFAPPSLSFFLYLISQLKYIGCFYLYTSDSKGNLVLYIVFTLLLLDAIAAALFHDLLLWVLFFLFIYCIKNRVTIVKRYAALVASLLLVLLLQSIKYEYRNIAWFNTSLSSFDKSEVFFGMISDRLLSPSKIFDAKANESSITRLNQGWIITRVMKYVPFVEPYADGETISGAFSAALLPRFLAEDKAMAGGRVMMQRFTGIELQEGTSMNISLIGEAYGNYGKENGVIFMFLIGIVYSLVLRYMFLKSRDNPTLLLWIPFLFMQVVKAETDLTTTLNHLVKATIVMFLIFFFFRKFLKMEL